MNMIERVTCAIYGDLDGLGSDVRYKMCIQGQAAIAAMRDPTPEMLDMARHVGPTIDKWQAMIDEALRDD